MPADHEGNPRYFDLQRRATAFKTAEGWRGAPHVSLLLDLPAGRITDFLRSLREHPAFVGIPVTVSGVMLKIIAEALKNCPELNAHIQFNNRTGSGHAVMFERIDVAVTMVGPEGRMITPVLRDVGRRHLLEVCRGLADLRRRLSGTDVDVLLLEAARRDLKRRLARGNLSGLVRLAANHVGKHRLHLPSRDRRRAFASVSPQDRLAPEDLENPTIVVSNIASVAPSFPGRLAMLMVIAPMTAAIGLSSIRKQPVVLTDEQGVDRVAIEPVLPLTLCFDHRMTDFQPLKGFLDALSGLCRAPEPLLEGALPEAPESKQPVIESNQSRRAE